MTKTFFRAILVFLMIGCGSEEIPIEDALIENPPIVESPNPETPTVDYRQEMRDFVITIKNAAVGVNSNFLVIPQNGVELISENGKANGVLNIPYLEAIDAHGQEDLFYGQGGVNQMTTNQRVNYLKAFLDRSKNNGNQILGTDYCNEIEMVDDAVNKHVETGYIGFAAPNRALSQIPTYPVALINENDGNVSSLSDVKNFLYLINGQEFSSKSEFINAIVSTNYDLLIMDAFFNDGSLFTASELDALKEKANGGSRLIIAYMSIGEAEDYRFYWKNEWDNNPPDWLAEENQNWPGNFKVKYWENSWQDVILDGNEAYLSKILNAGFDGVYLDLIDAFDYFESL
jgi:cysteinyl-tRNA synthetase